MVTIYPGSQRTDGGFHLGRQRGVILSPETQGSPERDSHRSGPGHPPRRMEDTIDPVNADRDDRDFEA